MKRILLSLAILLLVAGLSFAVGIQGEIVEIEDNEVRIKFFGDDIASLKTGAYLRLEVIPAGIPALGMLQG